MTARGTSLDNAGSLRQATADPALLAVAGNRVQIHAIGLRDAPLAEAAGQFPPGRIRVRMSYTECPRCGQKALSVATQCPRCGVPFETRHTYEVARPRPQGMLLILVVAALVVVFLGFDWFRRRPGAAGGEPAAPSVAAAPDSIRQPGPKPAPVAPKEPAAATADSIPRQPPRPAIETVATQTAPEERRYTNIWVNVRRARRPTAAVVKVLHPGEPVLVDSLSQGWYRVVADGQGVGYVYRGFVDTTPPAARP